MTTRKSQAGPLVALCLTTVLAFGAVAGQDWIDTALSRIYREHVAASSSDVGRLVLLDQELRSMIPLYTWLKRPFVPATHFRPEYAEIGVIPTIFDGDSLSYSGKLLVEAHQLNPDSPFRSYTLYSTIFGAGEASTEPPSTAAAERYLREFPDGPFVVDAHLALAHFYDDLHKLIRLEQSGNRVGYKFDCYGRHITSAPLSEQRPAARESAIRHYLRLVELLPEEPTLAKQLADIRQERNEGWFFCGD